VAVAVRRTAAPALRQRLGEWGVGAALLVAILRLGPVWLPLPWRLPVAPAPAPEMPPAQVPERVPEPEEFIFAWVEPPTHFAPAEAVVLTDVPAIQPPPRLPAAPEPVAAQAEPAWQWDWRWAVAAVAAAYLLAGAAVLARWLLSQWALARLLRRARPAPERLRRLFAETAGDVARLPRLLVSPRVSVPACCGLVRPAVVLPVSLVEAGDETALRWVFAHELTHLRRRDPWSCWGFALAQSVYFYVPWFWWLRRQVRLCQEYIADAAAAAEGPWADEYAQFLVSLARRPATPLGATGVLGNPSDLFRRVNMLLQSPARPQGRCPRRWSLASAGALFGGAILVSGLGLRAEATVAPVADLAVHGALPAGDALVRRDEAQDDKKADVQKKDEVKKDECKECKSLDDALLPLMLKRKELQTVGLGRLHPQMVQIEDAIAATTKLHRARAAGKLDDDDGDDKKKDEKKKKDDDKKKADDKKKSIQLDLKLDDLIKKGVDDAEIRKQVEEAIKKAREQLKDAEGRQQDARKAWEKAQKELRDVMGQQRVWTNALTVHGGDMRLGVHIDKPSAALADQLDLPKGQGLVIVQIVSDSAAAKAGLKANDILLEVDGKSVPSDATGLAKQLREVKADESVNIVVLRKGRKETVKGVKLPEAKAGATGGRRVIVVGEDGKPIPFDGNKFQVVPPIPPIPPTPPVPPVKGGAGAGGKDGKGTSVTVEIRDGEFKAVQKDGALTITVKGKADGGKVNVSEVNVEDDGFTGKYNDLNEVPAKYRDKVKKLISNSGSSPVRFEFRRGGKSDDGARTAPRTTGNTATLRAGRAAGNELTISRE
jgi:beta-lactamase regulating signal transducer with metallopeptidase domain